MIPRVTRMLIEAFRVNLKNIHDPPQKKKILRSLKKVSALEMGFCENIPISFSAWFLHHVLSSNSFFQRSLENFLWTLRTCSRYLKGPPDLLLWVRKKKKNRDCTTHQSKYMSGKVKKVEILKNEAQSHVGIFGKMSSFSESSNFIVSWKIF